LEFSMQQWFSCKLSANMFSSIYRLSDVLGVNGAFVPGQAIYWQLNLSHVSQYPCMQPPPAGHLWRRLQAFPARIEIQAPEGLDGLQNGQILEGSDYVHLGQIEADLAKSLHLNITALSIPERQIHDHTTAFKEMENEGDDDATGDMCCICLEPMKRKEMCRRLPCNHQLHAGCAMTFLPARPSCPVCRRPVGKVTASPQAVPFTTAPQRQQAPAAAPDLPALPQSPDRSVARSGIVQAMSRPPLPSVPSSPATSLPGLGQATTATANVATPANVSRSASVGAVALLASPAAVAERRRSISNAATPERRRRGGGAVVSPEISREAGSSRREVGSSSPMPRLVKALSRSLRAWSVPRSGRVTPQD
jgi:hypothetical protein